MPPRPQRLRCPARGVRASAGQSAVLRGAAAASGGTDADVLAGRPGTVRPPPGRAGPAGTDVLAGRPGTVHPHPGRAGPAGTGVLAGRPGTVRPPQAAPVQPRRPTGSRCGRGKVLTGRSKRRKVNTCRARSSARTRLSAAVRRPAIWPSRLRYTVTAEEAMTGRLMFGVGVNSDAGLVGTITLDEQNFDWTRFPNSWEDIRNGTAWRGAGQHLQLQAMPGTQVQRYSASFQEPYLFNTPVALGLSGFYYTRIYNEYTEAELGGRVALGYQFSPDLSGTLAYRGEKINITNPVDPDPLFLPLSEVTGRNLALHEFSVTLTNDKRDNAFMATEGHLIEGSIGEVLGSFAYPQASIDLRKYFTLYERPDGSGRHVLSLAAKAAYTGDNTPIYERFYAGGFSSLRGFQFRGVSPEEYDFITGQERQGRRRFHAVGLGRISVPHYGRRHAPRRWCSCDTGTVEPKINNWNNNYRVAPGFGLRIVVPAMGPAPIALDFAFPIAWQPGDTHEMFSFFVGFGAEAKLGTSAIL